MNDKPDPTVVMAALEAMTHDLRMIFRAPEKPGVNRVTVLQARYAAALANNVVRFLRDTGVGDDIAQRFAELAAAIHGLRLGIITDPVRPAEIDGRGPDGLTAWLLRGDVFLGLECFHRSGKFENLRKAAKAVAKRHRNEFDRLKRNPGDDLATSILSWRSRINQRKAPSSDKILAHNREFFAARGQLSPPEFMAEGEAVLAQAAREAAEAAL
jgi:hypothetical protein